MAAGEEAMTLDMENIYHLSEKLEARGRMIRERIGDQLDAADEYVVNEAASWFWFCVTLWNPLYEGSNQVHWQPQDPVFYQFKAYQWYEKAGVKDTGDDTGVVPARLDRLVRHGRLERADTPEFPAYKWRYVPTPEEVALVEEHNREAEEAAREKHSKAAARVAKKNELAMLRQQAGSSRRR